MTTPADGTWFDVVAAHLGEAYLRYSFTRGTAQEVEFLCEVLHVGAGSRLLDVGCGPGRHAHALAARGVEVVGLDHSLDFVRLAADGGGPGCAFARADARNLPVRPVFDLVMSVCQGGFGLLGGAGDHAAFAEMARAVRPGGHLVVTAFSAYFQLRWAEEDDEFDAATGVHHEHTTVRAPDGGERAVELWTTCFTPRELELMVAGAGLELVTLAGVEPGRWTDAAPTLRDPELLVIARRPSG